MCVPPDNSPSCEMRVVHLPRQGHSRGGVARVVGRGGRVGITDITAAPTRLPAGLTGLAARAACVVDARPAGEYRCRLRACGSPRQSTTPRAMDHRMIRQITSRLDLLKITARPALEEVGVVLAPTGPVLDAARPVSATAS